MSLSLDKTREQSKRKATIGDVGLDMLEILQYGQITLAAGAIIIVLRELLHSL